METTKCPECGYDVTRSRNKCPDCGCPIEHPSEQPNEHQNIISDSKLTPQPQVSNPYHTGGTDWDGTGYSLWGIDMWQYMYESFMIAKHTFFKKFFCFHGRTTRREFWSFYFCGLAIPLAFILILPVFYIMLIAAIFPYLGVTIRRLHDNGHSGWWVFAPPFCFFYCLQQNNPYPNEYGNPPSNENLF